ncbi:sigma-70 family RNA polymerase sigma factor, partial [Streptococcus rupicaprae]
MKFETIYAKVTGIVHKTRKDYYIQLWDQSDWDQEGMFVLSRLLVECPGIEEREGELYRYFKTKFRNYVLDMVRKQESHKRRINR